MDHVIRKYSSLVTVADGRDATLATERSTAPELMRSRTSGGDSSNSNFW